MVTSDPLDTRCQFGACMLAFMYMCDILQVPTDDLAFLEYTAYSWKYDMGLYGRSRLE